MTKINHAGYYANVFSQWARDLGSKPSEAQLSLAHVFGRPGKQSLAVAMALRDGGVTATQIKGAAALVDGKATPQLNHMRDLITAGMFDREAVPGAYAIALTSKGQTFVDLHGSRVKATEAKADKPKAEKVAKPKATKAKGKKAEVTSVPAEQVPVTAEATQPTA